MKDFIQGDKIKKRGQIYRYYVAVAQRPKFKQKRRGNNLSFIAL